jgi:hypothetical protein
MAWTQDLFDPTPTPEEVAAQLRRVLASPEFSRAARMRDLLRFVVGRVLEGREDLLTSPVLAAQVFQRREFNPETDSIVRTEASRLRHRLHAYYSKTGRRDRVVILLGRGDYLPVFRLREVPASRGRIIAAVIAGMTLAAIAVYYMFR